MQLGPIRLKFKPPGIKHLKLKCDILLSTSAFKFNLYRYPKVARAAAEATERASASSSSAAAAASAAAAIAATAAYRRLAGIERLQSRYTCRLLRDGFRSWVSHSREVRAAAAEEAAAAAAAERQCRGRAVQVDPMNPTLKPPGM